MANFSFDELLAKREQRKADKLTVTQLHVPDSDKTLTVKKLTDSKLLDLLGRIADAQGDLTQILQATDEALYHACDQLQDPKLREALELSDPLDVVPALFDVAERNALGHELAVFLGIWNDDQKDGDTESPVKN